MTFPYLNNQMIFYTRADAGIDSLEDLAGKSVAVQNGSYAEELLAATMRIWPRPSRRCWALTST